MPADPRGISLSTPLGPDALFLTAFRGHEGLSQLFNFHLELAAENRQNVAFDKLLGQKIGFSIILPDGKTKRFWNGICKSMSQAGRDSTFTQYRMEVVPQMWLLSRRTQCRIFQHQSVPNILKAVFAGLDVKFELQGTFEPRDYCVQYRESDFDFASRLMEEEGIYYFFKFGDGTHQLIVGNSPQTHPAVPFSEKVIFEELEGGNRTDMRIHHWEKNQELRSGKVTLRDHCFELPHQTLQAERPTPDAVQVGKVAHKLKLPANEALELYDYPGGYAGRFDGIDKGGGEKPGDLQKIFQDNKRTAAIRMDQEAVQAIYIRGSGNCRDFAAGHKFTLDRHPDADGAYVITSVDHVVSAAAGLSSGEAGGGISYRNSFTCLPLALPFRPTQVTRKPQITGPQNATVVGPPGEEIFTDKYGRVKVQFPWDRQGKNNADSSCWIRVGVTWADRGFGFIQIPRIGQEVIVDFMEGDPDQPIITGCVYTAATMPPFALPGKKMISGFKSNSYPGGGGYNQITLDDTKGQELLHIHGQYDMDTKVLHNETVSIGVDRTEQVGSNEKITIGANRTESVGSNETISIGANRTESVGSNETITIGGNRSITVSKNETATVALMRTHTVGINEAITIGAAQEVTVGGFRAVSVGAAQTVSIGGSHTITVGGGQSLSVGKDLTEAVAGGHAMSVGKDQSINIAKKLTIEAGEEITIKTGDAVINMKKDGTIGIKGKDITIEGSGKITGKASSDMVLKGSKIGLN